MDRVDRVNGGRGEIGCIGWLLIKVVRVVRLAGILSQSIYAAFFTFRAFFLLGIYCRFSILLHFRECIIIGFLFK